MLNLTYPQFSFGHTAFDYETSQNCLEPKVTCHRKKKKLKNPVSQKAMGKHPLVKEKNINGTEEQKLGGEGTQPRSDIFCTRSQFYFAVFLQLGKTDMLLAPSLVCCKGR